MGVPALPGQYRENGLQHYQGSIERELGLPALRGQYRERMGLPALPGQSIEREWGASTTRGQL